MNNKYIEKVAARYASWYEDIPTISKMNKQIKEFSAKIAGLRNARKQLLSNKAFAASTKRRYSTK